MCISVRFVLFSFSSRPCVACSPTAGNFKGEGSERSCPTTLSWRQRSWGVKAKISAIGKGRGFSASWSCEKQPFSASLVLKPP